MKKIITLMLMILATLGVFTSCKSNEEKVKETAEAYLYKNMKNPESLKILSCEVRRDTIPFWLSEDMFDMAESMQKAFDKFSYYSDMSYLFASEKYETANAAREAKEALQTAYKNAQQNEPVDVEYIAYIKSSGTNPMGGTVSNSSIIIVDMNDPTKILGTYLIDTDFIKRFVAIKMFGENYDFKKNKFGKYETEGMPYFEQFIMNDAE